MPEAVDGRFNSGKNASRSGLRRTTSMLLQKTWLLLERVARKSATVVQSFGFSRETAKCVDIYRTYISDQTTRKALAL